MLPLLASSPLVLGPGLTEVADGRERKRGKLEAVVAGESRSQKKGSGIQGTFLCKITKIIPPPYRALVSVSIFFCSVLMDQRLREVMGEGTRVGARIVGVCTSSGKGVFGLVC